MAVISMLSLPAPNTNDSVVTEFHFITSNKGSRRLAYSRIGEFDAQRIFLCLPGLLETRESFHSLLELTTPYSDCCWLSLDYCGRGLSDSLSETTPYAISQYIEDAEAFLDNVLRRTHLNTSPQIHLIGTSMGGIVALHLAKRLKNHVACIVLNDIGLYLQWSSLISLYNSIKEDNKKLTLLDVDPRAIQDVQNPSHFDLPYDFDLVGMRFDRLLSKFTGQVVLVHNADSPICSSKIAHQSKSKFSELNIWTLQRPGHPATWDHSIVLKLAQLLKLKIKPVEKIQFQTSSTTSEFFQQATPISTATVSAFLATSKAYLESSHLSHSKWLQGFKIRWRIWKNSFC